MFRLKEEIERDGWKTYMAIRKEKVEERGRHKIKDVQIIPQLLFVKCTKKWLDSFKSGAYKDYFMVYRQRVVSGSGQSSLEAAPIPEAQMNLFIFVTSAGDGTDISYYGGEMQSFVKGEKVRVTEGPYKGAIGVVKRIKRDRKLLVAVEGVTVVAISKIPAAFLEKI